MAVPKSTKTRKTYLVDRMMRQVASSLVRDFQTNLMDPGFCSEFQRSLTHETIPVVRSLVPAFECSGTVQEFKALYQIHSLFKRYRFRNDTYSDEELSKKAISLFDETQRRIADIHLDHLPANSQAILDGAAVYIAKVLGEYSDEEHRSLCRFGSKASVGIPAREACEAARWELPLSGSSEQITWFDSEMSQIESVQDYWAAQRDSAPSKGPTYRVTDSLALTLVPKTFKSLRCIMPNTTIGSYMSFGLGEMIRKRLKREGYDIRCLQMRHRDLACRASMHSLHVTADLSSASDSISVQLVQRLFPRDWLDILTRSRIGKVTLPDGRCVESETFCTMGIGYTFPLQTLVFLALLKSIQAFYFEKSDQRTISVYGDDLIYSSRMHQYVVQHFERFGFVINLDKTFHEGNFRESCGGDYYHGVDVRPFQPRNGQAEVGQRAYEAILYKFVNGLLARWSEYEIENTLRYLLLEIEHVTGKSKIVPCDYPDDAGIKCTLPLPKFLEKVRIAKPKHLGHGVFRFSYLRLVPDLRKEERHGPYLWSALRGGLQLTAHWADYRWSSRGSRKSFFYQEVIDLVNRICGRGASLLWYEVKPIKLVRCSDGQRRRRLAAFVTVSHTGRYMRQSGTSCFEDRR